MCRVNCYIQSSSFLTFSAGNVYETMARFLRKLYIFVCMHQYTIVPQASSYLYMIGGKVLVSDGQL
jgi:hypothetical protein